MTADTKANGKGPSNKPKGKQEEELSAEDAKLKEDLALLVERIDDTEEGVAMAAVTALQDQIRSATASVTSVPKPLKFLRGHYDHIKTLFKSLKSGPLKPALADVLSVLGMTMAESGTRECLGFKLQVWVFRKPESLSFVGLFHFFLMYIKYHLYVHLFGLVLIMRARVWVREVLSRAIATTLDLGATSTSGP